MDAIWNIEINITLFLQSLGHWLTFPFTTISFLATEEFFIVVMPLIFWCIDSLLGVRMGIMLIVSGGLNYSLKMLFHTPRPFWFDKRVKSLSSETGFGMPSGHSQNSASLWGMMAVGFKKKWFTILSLFVIFIIGLSRIYLGMHFLHDVLTGWLVAGILLVLYLWLEKPASRWIAGKKLPIQILYIFLFSALVVLLSVGSRAISMTWHMPASWIETAAATGGATPDPYDLDGAFTLAGVSFGFLSGYAWWVKKYGMPKVEGVWSKRLLRFFVGIIGVIIFYVGLKLVFPKDPVAVEFLFRFIRYTIIGVWVSAIAPLIFKKLKLNK